MSVSDRFFWIAVVAIWFVIVFNWGIDRGEKNMIEALGAIEFECTVEKTGLDV